VRKAEPAIDGRYRRARSRSRAIASSHSVVSRPDKAQSQVALDRLGLATLYGELEQRASGDRVRRLRE